MNRQSAMVSNYRRLLVIVFLLPVFLLASCKAEAPATEEESYPGKPIIDTIVLDDPNFYTMDFPAFYGKLMEAIDPENGQISISTMGAVPGIKILYKANGDIEDLQLSIHATINSTDTELIMGHYRYSFPSSEISLYGSPVTFAREYNDEQFDFLRFRGFCDSFSAYSLRTIIETESFAQDRKPVLYKFVSDQLEVLDYINPDIAKAFYVMGVDGIKKADMTEYQGNEHRFLDLEGNYADAAGTTIPYMRFNDEEPRYYLVMPYYEQQYEGDIEQIWGYATVYYCNNYIIFFG
jgi:hypothetical protein